MTTSALDPTEHDCCERCDSPLDESTWGTFLDATGCHICEECWSDLDPPEVDAGAQTERVSGDAAHSTGPGAPDDDDRAPTERYLRAVFFGVPVPCYAADKPLPSHIVLGSTDQTRLLRTPRPR